MAQTEKYSYAQILEALLAAGLFVLVIYFITGYRPLVVASAALLACGLVSKKAALWIGNTWLTISHCIGTVNSRILLSIVFYAVLTPLAFAYRLFNPKLLQLRRGPNSVSYYIDFNKVHTKENFEKLW